MKYKFSHSLLIIVVISQLLLGCSLGFNHPKKNANNTNSSYGDVERGSYRGSYYRVGKGDTLYFISYVTNKDVKDLIAFNELNAPYTIHPGQRIKLWGPTYVSPAYGEKGYLPAKVPASTPQVAKNSNLATNKPVNRTVNSDSNNNNVTPVIKENVKKVENKKPKEYVIANKLVTNNKQNKPKLVGDSKESLNLKPESLKNSAVKVEVKPKTSEYTEPKPTFTTAVAGQSEEITSWLWPTKGIVIAKFSSGDQGNKGIDITGKRGQEVVSTARGTVVYAGNALRGYGNLIIIKHNDNYLSAYAHNETIFVKEGQNISAGQKIAAMGSSGTSNVRLHFEIRFKGKSVNPQRYLP